MQLVWLIRDFSWAGIILLAAGGISWYVYLNTTASGRERLEKARRAHKDL